MKKKLVITFISLIVILITVIILVGPQPSTDGINGRVEKLITINGKELENKIAQKESEVIGIKEDNEAKIIWANTEKTKTPYSILYLHGFSASRGEGEPVHRLTASYFGCNLFLARLHEHGIDKKDALLAFEPKPYLESAKEALKIAQQIGEKVVVMATSAGGMLALYLAAENPELIEALIIYSPLVDFFDGDVHLLNMPWGIELGKLITGSDYVKFNPKKELQKKYWTTEYRIEAVVNLVALNESIMTPANFKKITCPVFLGYYYKDQENQDKVVSVPAMLEMFEQLSTPDSLKTKVAFDDANEHVITSEIVSGNWQRVLDSTQYFMSFKLGLNPADELKVDLLELSSKQ